MEICRWCMCTVHIQYGDMQVVYVYSSVYTPVPSLKRSLS